MEYFIPAIIIWVICAFIGGYVNSSKGRSYGEGFVLGLVLGIIGLIIVAVLPQNEEGLNQSKLLNGSNKKCPYCAEIIKSDAIVCRYCGKELPATQSTNIIKSNTTVLMSKPCPHCGKILPRNTNTCVYCNQPVPEGFWESLPVDSSIGLQVNNSVNNQSTILRDPTKKCPYCAEIIKYEAIVCRYCGRELPAFPALEITKSSANILINKACPNCGKILPRNTNTCTYCNQPVPNGFWQ